MSFKGPWNGGVLEPIRATSLRPAGGPLLRALLTLPCVSPRTHHQKNLVAFSTSRDFRFGGLAEMPGIPADSSFSRQSPRRT
eukprot:320339-Amphidinium_carterae.1